MRVNWFPYFNVIYAPRQLNKGYLTNRLQYFAGNHDADPDTTCSGENAPNQRPIDRTSGSVAEAVLRASRPFDEYRCAGCAVRDDSGVRSR